MSDAITLDVLSSSPVQLDAGDADPIAREEIAALAGRVTTVEGDVTALDGRMDTAEGDISTLGTTVDGIDARVEAIEADYVTSEDVMGALGGEAPTLVAGSSRAVLGDADTESWMERTTAADGAALIESVKGNTIVQDGSLLPVRMEGVETVGFNQWDEMWELGAIRESDGSTVGSTTQIRSKNFIPVFPSTTYCNSSNYTLAFFAYDANKEYIGFIGNITSKNTFTTPAGYAYLMFFRTATTYDHDICINLSDPARNGEYEPHWSSQLAIPAATYFPQGLRSAGSVYDELRADAAVTRVGAVDLGMLTWTAEGAWQESKGLTRLFAPISDAVTGNSENVTASGYFVSNLMVVGSTMSTAYCIALLNGRVYVTMPYPDITTPADFNTWLQSHPVTIHYALATPTTTPIDPPLPLSYRVGADGTERVMVASGTTSAPPVFATRYPLDPADLAASIAPRESTTAEANHAVGDLIMLGFTLCKVTTAIARGEAITIGTNVTKTSVAAEIAALS